MNSRRLWNLHQRHKFLRAEASRNILKLRVLEITFQGVFKTYFPPRMPLLFHQNTHKTGSNAVEMSQVFHDITTFKHFTDLNLFKSYLPTLPVFLEVSKFFIKSPGLPVRAPNLPGIPTVAFFKIFFIDFVIFKMSKRKMDKKWI